VSWLRSCRRREPGWYLFRTRRHRGYGVEFGYIGKSKHLAARKRDHEGTGQWGQAPKSWMDLTYSYHKIQIPWWLGWDWVLLPIEALLIATLRPRYNDKLNPSKSKVRKYEQAIQRAYRDSYGNQPSMVRSLGNPAVVFLGVLLMVAGVVGWIVTMK